MRIRLPLLVALAFAASAAVASGGQLHLPPQQNLLDRACSTAATHIKTALNEASTTPTQTVETQLRVLKPGTLEGDLAFARLGSSLTVAADASAKNFSCGYGGEADPFAVGRGPGHRHIVSTLHEKFAAPGRYTLTFTLNPAGRNILARLGAAERAYRKRHPRGQEPPSIAWGVGLHYLSVR